MLKQSSNGMKRMLAILLAVLFVVSVTAAAVSAHPVVVKDKKTVIVVVEDVKIIKYPHTCHSCSSDDSPQCYTCSHGNCCNGISCHKCSPKGETICEN